MIRQLKKVLSKSRATSEKVEVLDGEAVAAEAGGPVAVRPKAKPPAKPPHPVGADAAPATTSHLSDATATLSDLSVAPPPPSRKQQPPAAAAAAAQPPGKSAWSLGGEDATGLPPHPRATPGSTAPSGRPGLGSPVKASMPPAAAQRSGSIGSSQAAASAWGAAPPSAPDQPAKQGKLSAMFSRSSSSSKNGRTSSASGQAAAAPTQQAGEGGDAVSHFSDRWQEAEPVQQHAGGRSRTSATQPAASTLLSSEEGGSEPAGGARAMGRSGSLRATPLAAEHRGQALL